MSFIIGLNQEHDSELVMVGELKHRSSAERIMLELFRKYSVDRARVIKVNLADDNPIERFNETACLQRLCKHKNKQYTFAHQLICTDCMLHIREFDKETIEAEVLKANEDKEELEFSASWR